MPGVENNSVIARGFGINKPDQRVVAQGYAVKIRIGGGAKGVVDNWLTRSEPFRERIDLGGILKARLCEVVDLIGTLIIPVKVKLGLDGVAVVSLDDTIDVEAALIRAVSEKIKMGASVGQQFQESVVIDGVEGVKIDERFDLVGTHSLVMNENLELVGKCGLRIKERSDRASVTEINEKVGIVAKKDISTVVETLVAAGLLDSE